jgi:hypothetical protein
MFEALVLLALAAYIRAATRRRPEPELNEGASLLAAFIEAGREPTTPASPRAPARGQ